MKQKKIQMFLFLFIIFFAKIVNAININEDKCKSIRLDSQHMSMQKMPVMDQASTALCYAYTASQLVDAWRFSHGDTDYEHLTSPLAAAVFSSSSQRNSINFGNFTDAYAAIKEYGSCKYENSHNKKVNTKKIDKAFSVIRRSFDIVSIAGYPNIDGKKYARETACSLGYLLNREKNEIEELNKIVTQVFSKITGDEGDAKKYVLFLQNVFKSACANEKIKQMKYLPNMKYFDISNDPKEKQENNNNTVINRTTAINEIQKMFNSKNPQPIAIGYCEEILEDKRIVSLGGQEKLGLPVRICNSPHASIIIGQRFNSKKNKCEFLIRNTYGKSCKNYKWDCDNGQIWINAETIVNSMDAMSYLE